MSWWEVTDAPNSPYVSAKPFKLRIGSVELGEEDLAAMLEAVEFVRFLRTRDPNWESLWAVFKTTKRLEE